MKGEHGVLTTRPPGKSQLVEKESRTHFTQRGSLCKNLGLKLEGQMEDIDLERPSGAQPHRAQKAIRLRVWTFS